MAPIRSLLASRAVLAGLAALGCLGLLISTLDSDTRNNLSWKYNNNSNQSNRNVVNPENNQVNTIWEDANTPSSALGKTLSQYPGRKPRTVQAMIEKAEGYYQRIVRQRHANLQLQHFGTP
jgi:hypothetical protein